MTQQRALRLGRRPWTKIVLVLMRPTVCRHCKANRCAQDEVQRPDQRLIMVVDRRLTIPLPLRSSITTPQPEGAAGAEHCVFMPIEDARSPPFVFCVGACLRRALVLSGNPSTLRKAGSGCWALRRLEAEDDRSCFCSSSPSSLLRST